MSNSKNSYFWQDEDTEILFNIYPTKGLSAACQALPHKKRGTIATQASRLKLTNSKPRKRNVYETPNKD